MYIHEKEEKSEFSYMNHVQYCKTLIINWPAVLTILTMNRPCIQIVLRLEFSVHDIWKITSEKMLYFPDLELEKDFKGQV